MDPFEFSFLLAVSDQLSAVGKTKTADCCKLTSLVSDQLSAASQTADSR
jgi:hypothetical protein